MQGLVIDVIGPFTEEVIEIPEHPERLPLGVHRFRHEPWLFARLGIPEERVNELGLGRPKEPLHHGTKAWLGPWARFLSAVVLGEHTLKIHTVKFFPPIDHQRLGQAAILAYTDP